MLQALIHGLDRHYYSINISYHHTERESSMLMNLYKKTWCARARKQKCARMRKCVFEVHNTVHAAPNMLSCSQLRDVSAVARQALFSLCCRPN